MSALNLNEILDELLATDHEAEVVEFKEARQNYDFNKLGKYFTALCNEANLKSGECAWLVFGVEDDTHAVVCTRYRESRAGLDNLKNEIASQTTGSIEAIIEQDAPQEFYRNRLLAEAMVELNMIDTIGSGIKRMFTVQRNRYFPLPDFDVADPRRAKVTIPGSVIDENYTRTLMENSRLDLATVIALDRVQKGRRPSRDEIALLRRQGLVEGRVPNLYVAARVAAVTDDRAGYIRRRAKRDLADMVHKGVLLMKGKGRGAYYDLAKNGSGNGSEMGQMGQETHQEQVGNGSQYT